MKNSIKYSVALILALTTSFSVFAQKQNKAEKPAEVATDSTKAEAKHRIGLWLDGGYSNLLYKSDYTKGLGGPGGGLSLFYELQKGHFLMNIGAGFQLYTSALKVNDFSCPTGATISNGQGTGDLLYNFEHYREKQMMGQAELAMLFGAQFNKIYFLVGPKVGAGVMGSYKVKTNASTSFQDNQLIGEFKDMENHGFTSYEGITPKIDNKKLSFKIPNVMLSAEVGYDFTPQHELVDKKGRPREATFAERLHYRVAVFADYGLLNIHNFDGNAVEANSAVNYPLVKVTGAPSNDNISAYTALGNGQLKDNKLNSLFVGVKLAISYELKKKEPEPEPEIIPTLYTYVTDKRTNAPLDTATVTYRSETLNRVVARRRTDRKEGKAFATVKQGSYVVAANRGNYIADSITVIVGPKDDTVRIALQPMPVYTCSVYDVESGKNLKASAELIDATTGEVVMDAPLDSINNVLKAKNLDPQKAYAVRVSAPGYMTQTEGVEDIDGHHTIYMSPIRQGAKIVLKNLFFVFAKTELLEESNPELDQLHRFLTENPRMNVKIVGHTDNVGSDELNQKLSEGRAKAVVDEMIRRGIAPERMEYEGRGEKEPVATNDTDEGRQENRRVELIVQ